MKASTHNAPMAELQSKRKKVATVTKCRPNKLKASRATAKMPNGESCNQKVNRDQIGDESPASALSWNCCFAPPHSHFCCDDMHETAIAGGYLSGPV